MTTTSIDRACPRPDAGAETELRAAARRRGLTMKELAALMGVSASYLSQIANGRRPWTPKMREKAAAVLGEVPRTGDRLPAGRRGPRGEQLHQGARPHPGHDHEGPGRPRWGVLQLHDPGGPGPPEHGREGPGPGRVGRSRPLRRSPPHGAPTARASS